MAVEHHSGCSDQFADRPAPPSTIEEGDVEHRHETIRTMMDAFMEGDGYESGARAVYALDRTAVWGPCPGVILAVALRKSATAPVT